MTNVKPGDLARVIADPSNQGILNAMVLVVEEGKGPTSDLQRQTYGGPSWRVELLETRRWRRLANFPYQLLPPGTKLLMVDKILRPLPPLTDTEDVFSTRDRENTL